MGSLSRLTRDGGESLSLPAEEGEGGLWAEPAARRSRGSCRHCRCCRTFLFWSARARVGCAGPGVRGTLCTGKLLVVSISHACKPLDASLARHPPLPHADARVLLLWGVYTVFEGQSASK